MAGNIIGVFILGILAGWLAEWLFITFVMNKKQQTLLAAEDTSASDHAASATDDTAHVVNEEDSKSVDTETASVVMEKQQAPEERKERSEGNSASTNIAINAQAVEENKTTKQDDFMQLKGIGPKLSASIKAININRYDELANFTGEALLKKLESSGAVIVNRPAFFHIPQQAALAAKGDWDGLETLKKSI